ncbi:zinc-binding alcohol dehydrogenase [Paenibacillus sp. GCM10027626]|uniref:zinc-dependent alcohol dehydrogenase n=1 Tax=Paenibacillus sp. GCM10027626 TaxID=3273411 RepID=UPI003635EB56
MKAAKSENGKVEIVELPLPEVDASSLLVRTDYSALSTGTELMVLRKHINAFLGYSGTGVVDRVGSAVADIKPGQRVACYGVPTHAEYFVANRHHVAAIPDEIDSREAAFAGIASIAIQGMRQADLRFGETVIVLGLGILGQLAAQIAHAAAYQVIAVDMLEERCQIAEKAGIPHVCRSAEEVGGLVHQLTAGKGSDCVMICSSSKAQRLIDQGLDWIRDKGKIVIVGDTNTEFERDKLFQKEAQITISRAGGPGRYDREYEEEGRDYPYGYVRWTLNRNLSEFVRLLAGGRLNLQPLITGMYALEQIEEAYQASLQHPAVTMGQLLKF